jgi:F-type H+-transporting ATPase subunit delta
LSNSGTYLGQIAERYASALFDLAKEGGNLDAVAKDLEALSGLIASNAEVASLVKSPLLRRDQASLGMGGLMNRIGVDPTTWKFVKLLAEKRRLFVLPQIAKAFANRIAEQRGEMTAEVVSAQALKEGQVAAIKATLRDTYKRDIRLETRVDPTLIGGFVLKAASRQVDTSIRSKLQALSSAMKG